MFQIYCDLHFADLALMESSDFMNQLRAFKPQSLGCAVARRKSSTTLIFPLPPQACSGETRPAHPGIGAGVSAALGLVLNVRLRYRLRGIRVSI